VGGMGGTNARIGHSDFLVVESDESDGSFLKLAPILAVVTNIDREHLDHYEDIEAIRAAFTAFVNKVPFYGAAIVCIDDENVQQILSSIGRRVITYGISATADYVVTESSCGHLASDFRLTFHGRDLGLFRLPLPGFHNVLDATEALAVARALDVDVEQARQALESFSGVDRRFQIRGREQGVVVIDDYGHHPTEIRATLDAARQCSFRRIHAIFQPHRYSRTYHLLDEFARSFSKADTVQVLDIYAASEKPIEGISAERLVERMRSFGHRGASYAGTEERAVEAVLPLLEAGDAVITQGAGSVWQAGDRVLEALRRKA
ncbi:MAG: Mur ligase family protein, partial [Acidobacteria bacterium]|nr:Mur ligase family protein [Acidobacteriota bacterium]